jgi:hypothetical protein
MFHRRIRYLCGRRRFTRTLKPNAPSLRVDKHDCVVLHDGRPANEPAELSLPTREATVEATGLILEAMPPGSGR